MRRFRGIIPSAMMDEKNVIVILKVKSTSRRTLKMLLNQPPGHVPTKTIPICASGSSKDYRMKMMDLQDENDGLL